MNKQTIVRCSEREKGGEGGINFHEAWAKVISLPNYTPAIQVSWYYWYDTMKSRRHQNVPLVLLDLSVAFDTVNHHSWQIYTSQPDRCSWHPINQPQVCCFESVISLTSGIQQGTFIWPVISLASGITQGSFIWPVIYHAPVIPQGSVLGLMSYLP